jgi:hypothetical protein
VIGSCCWLVLIIISSPSWFDSTVAVGYWLPSSTSSGRVPGFTIHLVGSFQPAFFPAAGIRAGLFMRYCCSSACGLLTQTVP